MNFLSLNNTTRLPIPLSLKVTSLLLICLLAWVWGFKTNGVLENTMVFEGNPLGYSYILDSVSFGPWFVNREAFYYLTGMQAFLGVPDVTIPFGNAYEITRTLYCLLLRSFWFLEPIMASFVLDILLWFLAAISAAFIASTFSNKPLAPWIAAFSVIFGQGFLHSAGEGIPHVLGYTGGFYTGALICLFRTWKPNCRFGEDLAVYLFIGLWQIGYGTALFYLPLALFCTGFRLKQLSVPFAKQFLNFGVYLLIALFPFFFISTVMKFVAKTSGETGTILELMKNYTSIGHYIWSYLLVFIDGLLSLGPFIVISFVWLLWSAYYEKYKDLQILLLIFLAQYALMIVLITPLAGRGYATYNLVLIPVIFFAIKMGDFLSKKRYKTEVMAILVLGFFLYPNAMKLGFRLPNQAFHMGWLPKISTRWQTYELHYFK